MITDITIKEILNYLIDFKLYKNINSDESFDVLEQFLKKNWK